MAQNWIVMGCLPWRPYCRARSFLEKVQWSVLQGWVQKDALHVAGSCRKRLVFRNAARPLTAMRTVPLLPSGIMPPFAEKIFSSSSMRLSNPSHFWSVPAQDCFLDLYLNIQIRLWCWHIELADPSTSTYRHSHTLSSLSNDSSQIRVMRMKGHILLRTHPRLRVKLQSIELMSVY